MLLYVLHQHDFVGIHLQVAVSQLHLYTWLTQEYKAKVKEGQPKCFKCAQLERGLKVSHNFCLV